MMSQNIRVAVPTVWIVWPEAFSVHTTNFKKSKLGA